MKEFGALLKEFMTEAEVSINHFASEIQLDRGWLYAVFQGKKDLPEEKLSLILSMDYFSEPQKKELREAFYIGAFGIRGYRQVKAIEAGFKAYAENNSDFTTYKMKSDIELSLSDTVSFCKREELTALIAKFLELTINENCDYIYTNYSYTHKDIDAVVFEKLKGSERFFEHFYHFVTLEKSDSGTGNISAFFQSIKYIQLRCNILNRYESHNSKKNRALPLPYYFLSPAGIILYDDGAKNGMWIPKEKSIFEPRDLIPEIPRQYSPMTIFTASPMDLQNRLSDHTQMLSSINSIASLPCLSHYLTGEELKMTVNPELPNKEFLIRAALEYYKFPPNVNTIVTYEGLLGFATNGQLPDIPPFIVQIIPRKIRAKIFERMISEVNNNPLSIRILKENSIPGKFALDFYSKPSSVFLGGTISKDKDMQYLGEFLIPIKDTEMRKCFGNYLKYLSGGALTHSRSYTIKLLNKLQMLCMDPQDI